MEYKGNFCENFFLSTQGFPIKDIWEVFYLKVSFASLIKVNLISIICCVEFDYMIHWAFNE